MSPGSSIYTSLLGSLSLFSSVSLAFITLPSYCNLFECPPTKYFLLPLCLREILHSLFPHYASFKFQLSLDSKYKCPFCFCLISEVNSKFGHCFSKGMHLSVSILLTLKNSTSLVCHERGNKYTLQEVIFKLTLSILYVGNFICQTKCLHNYCSSDNQTIVTFCVSVVVSYYVNRKRID